eukprot:SAG11_NODE_1786_length_4258_cov_1.965617_4_plen_83_part_00
MSLRSQGSILLFWQACKAVFIGSIQFEDLESYDSSDMRPQEVPTREQASFYGHYQTQTSELDKLRPTSGLDYEPEVGCRRLV